MSTQVLSNVRAELARKGVSQAVIAEELGLSQQSLSRRLRGHSPLSVDELVRIAELLELDPRELLVAS